MVQFTKYGLIEQVYNKSVRQKDMKIIFQSDQVYQTYQDPSCGNAFIHEHGSNRPRKHRQCDATSAD